jgi:hypothetical protein
VNKTTLTNEHGSPVIPVMNAIHTQWDEIEQPTVDTGTWSALLSAASAFPGEVEFSVPGCW